jgi:hypothetical protein
VNFFGEGRTPRLPGVNEKDKQQAGKGNCFILLFLDDSSEWFMKRFKFLLLRDQK